MADGTAPASPDRGPSAVLVSACLVGVPCNHRGAASLRPAVVELGTRFALVPICPEVAGGLPVPRDAAELVPGTAGGPGPGATDRRVETVAGDDVTAAYERGAAAAVAVSERYQVIGAVLKARSPSCGCRQVYDGTFSRTLVDNAGVTAVALRAAGVPVVSEEDLTGGGDPFGH